MFEAAVEPAAPVRWQWQHDDADIPGATNSTLQLRNVSVSDTGSYRIIATGMDPESLPTVSQEAGLAVRKDGFVFGGLRRERWDHIAGRTLDALTNSPAFRQAPDNVDWVPGFESAPISGSRFGIRLSGFLIPKETGDYEFLLASDDQGALFLSDDDTPERLRLVASEEDWSAPRDWGSGTPQGPGLKQSLPVRLEGGRRYRVEALLKQDDGGNHLSVAWKRAGDPLPPNGSPPISGGQLLFPEDPRIPETSAP